MSVPAAAPPAGTESESKPGARFRVEGMDCAACARTVQKIVARLDGAENVQVFFGTATLNVGGDVSPAAIQAAVRRAGYTARPVGEPVGPVAPFWRRSVRALSTSVSAGLLIAAVVASVGGAPRVVSEPLYLLSMAAGGWFIALAALQSLRRRALDMNVLMSMAGVGAVAIGDYAEAAWVLVLFALGTTLESFALDRSRRSVEALMELAPEHANVLVDGEVTSVAVEEVAVGSRVLVRAGERVALDGVVVSGSSSVDESALTGESVPVDKEPGAQVFAGTLNAFGALTVEVSVPSSQSTLARVAQLVADAQGSQAPSERFVDRFARYYTPLVFVAAVLVAIVPTLAGGAFDTWLYRALALLIVACPCALVISVPVSVVSAIGGAARRGVLIKGGQALEDLGRIRAVALDKTGTLTEGTPRLAAIIPLGGEEADTVLALMAAVERGSEHPLGAALVRAAQDRGITVAEIEDFEALPGLGARAHVAGRPLWAGGPRMAREQAAVLPAQLQETEQRGQTAIMLGEGPKVLAVFGLADQPRAQAPGAVRDLRDRAGVHHVVMLTGDNERVARAVARHTGVSEWRAGLLPQDKLTAVRELQQQYGSVAMVGDGVNDAPALAAATVGVAMGAAGSGIALETADVALMGDDLERLPDAIVHSRRALRIMRQNVVVALASKAVFVILAPLGYVTLVLAVAADMGVSLLVTLNGLRLLDRRRAVAAAPEQPSASTECADGCGATSAAATSASLPVVAPTEHRGAADRCTAETTPDPAGAEAACTEACGASAEPAAVTQSAADAHCSGGCCRSTADEKPGVTSEPAGSAAFAQRRE